MSENESNTNTQSVIEEESEQRVNSGKVHEIKLVSGLKVLARKFLLGDEDVWSDEGQMRQGIGVILDRIIVDVIDPVFYVDMGIMRKFGDSWQIDWTRVLSGDRVVLLMENRVRTYGSDYSFLWKCPQCDNTRYFDVDLQEMLNSRQSLPDDSIENFKSGEPFIFRLPDEGVNVSFDLQIGKHEKMIADMQRSGQLDNAKQSLSLMPRIREIEGVKDAKKKYFLQKEMTSSDAGALRDEMDRVDCGIDLSMVAGCRSCNYVGEIDLPFGRGFLSPQKAIQARRRAKIEQTL
jgi:hypothetical protein